MKLVVDAVGVRPGSAAVVIGNLLRGWTQIAPDDEIVVLTDGPPRFPVPTRALVERVTDDAGALRRLLGQSVGVRRACRRLGADAVLSAVTAGTLAGARCPSGAIVYDLRHERRPEQFSLARRVSRRLLYGWTFHRADALFCISERTRQDLLTGRPGLAGKAHVALLGADHAVGWTPAATGGSRYVLAFGHFAHKNIDGVLQGWAHLDREPDLVLRICGLGAEARARTGKLLTQLGVTDRVELLGWLDDREFEAVFAGASAVLFPSDFEGFGLPVMEALVLGVPVVISTDPALLEITDGHAVVAADDRPETMAAAIERALRRTPDERAAGAAHARHFTWARAAGTVRGILSTGERHPQ